PIDTNKLKSTLDKVYTRICNRQQVSGKVNEAMNSLDPESATITKIPVHYKDKVNYLEMRNIVSVRAEEGYTVFTMANADTFTSSKQLSEFEFIFDPFK